MQLQSATSEPEHEGMKTDFRCAMRNLAITSDTVTGEGPPVGVKAYRSNSDELSASKDEVRSLKKTLADLTSQIQELLKQHARNRGICIAQGVIPQGGDLFLPLRKREGFASCECHRGGSLSAEALLARRQIKTNYIAELTPRQREILDMVLAGLPSKKIAAHLCISQRTVENHRASIMKKTGSKSLSALIQLALFSSGSAADGDGQRPPNGLPLVVPPQSVSR